MHQISKQTIEKAQKHAQEALEQSKEVEQLAKSLQINDQIGEEQKERILANIETMHKHAQKFQDLVYRLAEDPSTDVYSEAIKEHIKVNEAHMKVNKEFQNIEPPA
ncbi:MAG: hypothetical protein V7K48_28960 [Nostoc sp.]|uniref:hypothetical protein n=1 Tax=Nostoc sp. TaxID=1180 RepID=UPI002FF926B3